MEKMIHLRCSLCRQKLTHIPTSTPRCWYQPSLQSSSASKSQEEKDPSENESPDTKDRAAPHFHSEQLPKADIGPRLPEPVKPAKSPSSWDRVRFSLSAAVNSLNAVSAVMPPRLITEIQKYIPSTSGFREKVGPSLDELKDSLQRKTAAVTEMVTRQVEENQSKLPVKMEKPDLASPKEEQMFSKAMEEINESISSFYDSSAVPREKPYLNQRERNSVEVEKAEEFLAWSVFQSPWRSSQDPTRKQFQKKLLTKKDFVSKVEIDNRTKSLVNNLQKAKSIMSKLSRTEELCKHLRQFPDSRSVADKASVVPLLLKFSLARDKALRAQANEALALVGHVRPVRTRGMRILTIDGGGTRGVVAIECLRSLEAHCATRVHDLFDYVCGVSTGSLIAALVFLYRLSLDEVEQLYKEFSKQMFTRNKLLGTGKLVWSHAFYDTEIWERILQQQMGKKIMIDFARDPRTPKLSGVSSLINVRKMKNFIFRNYNLPPNVYSHYPGSCTAYLWEVIRASSAAPGYFDPFVCGEYVHQDGGLLTNNPTALALHESRLLWPHSEIQCVVSMGTGRHEPTLEIGPTKVPLRDKISKIVDSATDTEAVHMTMQDLLPPGTYFRLNPYMSEEFMLDEIRSEKIEQMQREAQLYLRKNEIKMQRLTKQLLAEKRPDQKLLDWVKEYMKWM